jgi:PadR family transcriptional regulator PadR
VIDVLAKHDCHAVDIAYTKFSNSIRLICRLHFNYRTATDLDLRLLTYIEPQCIRLLRMDMSKDLVAASATPLVLAILAEGDSYGYAIIKRVAELSGGHLQWTDGMLYPVLHRLERQGHVAAKWSASESGRRRKYYRITREGRAQLAAQRQQWKAVDGTLRGIWMEACTV